MNDMKKLSEYKEFFYRDRSLEEFKNSPIWVGYIYPYIDEYVEHTETRRTPDNDYLRDSLLEEDIPNFCRNIFERCILWNNPLISRIEDIGKNIHYSLYDGNYYDELQELEIKSVLGVIWLLKSPSPQLLGVKNLLCNKFNPQGDCQFSYIVNARERYDFDFSLHPDFEALEQKNEAWWKEATGDYNEARIRTILSLYEGEEREHMRTLLKEKTEIELPAEAKVEAVEAKKEISLKMQTPEKETNFKSYILIKEKRDEIYDKIAELLEGKNKPKDIMMVLIGAHEAGVFNLKGCTHPTFEKTFPGIIKKNSYNDWSGKLDTNQYKTKYRSNYQNYKDIFVEFKD